LVVFPITVSRTYDTLTANQDGEVGFGWKLSFRDVDLRTSLPKTGDEAGGLYAPFRDGTRVYITLPGGQREGYTFRPKAVGLFDQFQRERDVPPEYQSGNGMNAVYFIPSFVPDKGVINKLSVPRYQLSKQGHEYFQFGGGLPYNPNDPSFGGRFTLTTLDGSTFAIDATTGKLNRAVSINGNSLLFDDSKVTSSNGMQVTFQRDARNRIVAVTDPAANKIQYTYNAVGDLVTVVDRDGKQTSLSYRSDHPHYLDEIRDPLNRPVTRTIYDDQGRIIGLSAGDTVPATAKYDPASNSETLTDPLGNKTIYQYDDLGNPVTIIDALGGRTVQTFDENGNVLSTTDPLNRTLTYTYDVSGRILTESNFFGGVTRRTYDVAGNATAIIDSLGNATLTSYDDKRNPLSVTDALGRIQKATYDASGNTLSSTDAVGNISSYTYSATGFVSTSTDAKGNQTQYSADSLGRRLSSSIMVTGATGQRPQTTTYTYDSSGNQLTSTNSLGKTLGYSFDGAGNYAGSTDSSGRRVKMTTDALGRATSALMDDGTTNTFTYDAAGRQIARTDAQGRVTATKRDALGRVIETVFPDGTSKKTEYDAAGQVIAEIDELGHRTTILYDDANRKITRRDSLGAEWVTTLDVAGRQLSETDALGRTTRFERDALGRLTRLVYPNGSAESTNYATQGDELIQFKTDPLGRITRYEYDPLGNLTAVIDPLNGRTEYVYDEVGHQVSQKDANGRVTRYEYDAAGRKVATILPSGSRSTIEYDGDGRIIMTTDFSGARTRLEYDPIGQLVAKRFDDGSSYIYTYTLGRLVETLTDSRGTTRYTYDARDRLLSRTDPDGQKITYTYDAAGNRTSLRTSGGITEYVFDDLNRVATVISPDSKSTQYKYDAIGNITRIELPNGVVETRSYDLLNRVTQILTLNGLTVLSELRYGFDAVSQTTSLVEQGGRQSHYMYDNLGRLTSEAITDPVNGSKTIMYSYDAIGNRTVRNDSIIGTTNYTYDENDQLLTEQPATGNKIVYQYDANGNIVSRDGGPNDKATYKFDSQNRLLSSDVTDATGTHHAEYKYDAYGTRVATIVDGKETNFVIDAVGSLPRVVVTMLPSGIVTSTYVYGAERTIVSAIQTSKVEYFGTDRVGSTRLITDAHGAVVTRYLYDAFGQVLTPANVSSNNYLFTGEPRDLVTGFDYLRARHYDPKIGRFVSRDSFQGRLDQPVSRSPYLYAANSPLDQIDPSGKSSISLMQLGALLLGGLVLRNFYQNSWIRFQPKHLDKAIKTAASVAVEAATDKYITENYVTYFNSDGNEPYPKGINRVKEVWGHVRETLEDSRFLDDGKHGVGPRERRRYQFFGNRFNPYVWNVPQSTRSSATKATFYYSEFGLLYRDAPDRGPDSKASALIGPILYWGGDAELVSGGDRHVATFAYSQPLKAVGGGNAKANLYNYLYYAEKRDL
jgi:RHS repeat-associated protein